MQFDEPASEGKWTVVWCPFCRGDRG